MSRSRLKRGSRWIERLEELTRPVSTETRAALESRWAKLPEHVRTDGQTLGHMAIGCEGTHGVFPRCNFTCTPCYHSADANRVRVDGSHTVREVERQMAFMEETRGPHAHAQLIGGEVSLLEPDDHAAALDAMRRHGRLPMSMTHGDFEYEYLKDVAVTPNGRRRFRRISFAAHMDITMRGRRELRRPGREADLNKHREQFCDMFARLRREYGVGSFLAHNMTVTPANIDQIPEVIRDCHRMGFNMFSFQPAAFVGDARRWKEDYELLDADRVWSRVEEGAGTRLPYRAFQTGDLRCNRTAIGLYVGDRWYPLVDENEPQDLEARDAFFTYLGGVYWNAPPLALGARLARVLAGHPRTLSIAAAWLARLVRRTGGAGTVLPALLRGDVRPMTFVMHRFMHATDVAPAWELLQRGEMSSEPRIRETQERLQACFYTMGHPETGLVVPACVQHSLLDPAENQTLVRLLPVRRERSAGARTG